MNDFAAKITVLTDEEFNFFKDLVYKQIGIFLAPHKKIMVQSRLNLRLKLLGLLNFSEYIQKLKREKNFFDSELTEIINRITTNKTDFFRENHHFEYLKNVFLPEKEAIGQKRVRIWSSASSTGEEPYSIAITVKEFLRGKTGWDIKIYASDIDTNVLKTASDGIYKEDKIQVIPADLKSKYFERRIGANQQTEYMANNELKAMIQYMKINLLEFPYPINEKVDLIFCRNVIIYFDKPTQKQIMDNFEKQLKEKGILILGHSETLFHMNDIFQFHGNTIYQKKK